MNTLNFLDANVWLALLWERHVHSAKTARWIEQADADKFLYCRFTQITVLRLLTTATVMGKDVLTMSAAWDLWDQVWADPRISFLPEPENLEIEFRSKSRLSSASPKVWADAYLLAFAAASGLRFVTFDRALKGNRVEVLVL